MKNEDYYIIFIINFATYIVIPNDDSEIKNDMGTV